MIAAHLDRQSLKELRSTCRNLSGAATEQLFKTLHLFPDKKAGGKFRSILKDDSIKDYVRKIYLNTYEKDSVRELALFSYFTFV